MSHHDHLARRPIDPAMGNSFGSYSEPGTRLTIKPKLPHGTRWWPRRVRTPTEAGWRRAKSRYHWRSCMPPPDDPERCRYVGDRHSAMWLHLTSSSPAALAWRAVARQFKVATLVYHSHRTQGKAACDSLPYCPIDEGIKVFKATEGLCCRPLVDTLNEYSNCNALPLFTFV